STNTDQNLRFDPVQIATYLEASYRKFVGEVGFVSDSATKNLGRYKIIVVMNETYEGANGPTGWAFGSSYDNTIGAMWVHPNATRDPYVLSHEFAHTLQAQNAIEGNTAGGGFVGFEPAGWFWEAHANYMRCVEFPTFASDDMPRWLATRSYHLSSTRHHYSSFRWLMTIEDAYGGIDMVTRLWKESRRAEHPLMTLRRLKNWNQDSLNDFIYDYATREVAFDYPTRGFGTWMRRQREIYRTDRTANHYVWREHTILDRVDSASGHFRVSDFAAPQEYGFNIIPLHTTCTTRSVQVRFRGHDESDSTAGWRWGFVAVAADGVTTRYGPLSRSSDGAATFTMLTDETALYLVVVGAPSRHTSHVWEPGWPKLRRFPYEVRIENAVPEGYQSSFRADLRTLFPGARHVNGGGWISNNATVASSVFVGPHAAVLGASRLSGNVRVDGRARLERVTADGRVQFGGDATIVEGTYRDSTVVTDRAILYDCRVSGGTHIGGNAFSWGATFVGPLVIGGDAEPSACEE
ncbi:MAG: multidrug transporter, partial [bacterium]|nr:multidrug transporter [Candidatus Kapabacteria bacterium]